ncbi:MAG: hypothetical protein ACRD36_12065, partial [Candidatus Acidiferrum sp.]
LREPYKNPMNKENGSWRFVYVTPAGQLIGSVRYTSLQQMAFLDKQRQMGITTGTGAADVAAGIPPPIEGSNSQIPVQPSPQQGVSGGPGVAPGNLPAPPQPEQNGQPQNAPPGILGSQTGQQPTQQPVQPFFSQGLQAQTGTSPGLNVSESSDSSGPVIGGFIIGVAGKSDKPSIKVYKGGGTYKRWEFIFNPLEQVQTIGTVSTGLGLAPKQQSGTVPFTMPQPPQPQPPQPQIPQQQ